MENRTDRSFAELASVGFFTSSNSRTRALSCSPIVVEVPGIEPGSFGIKTGLLRA